MIELHVIGIPKPKGSPRPLKLGNGKVILSIHQTDDAQRWERAVALAASKVRPAIAVPCVVELIYRLPRPKSVKRAHPSVKPDIDKLERCVLDALVLGGALLDDALVLAVFHRKRYVEPGEVPGVSIRAALVPRLWRPQWSLIDSLGGSR